MAMFAWAEASFRTKQSSIPQVECRNLSHARGASDQASQTADGDPEQPLLWFLRDGLRLTSTKYAPQAAPVLEFTQQLRWQLPAPVV